MTISLPPAVELCGIRTFPEGRAVVFSVEITKPMTSRVLMEIAWAGDAGDRSSVVFVETQRFVAAWRREPYGFNKEAAHGTLDRERLEKKYKAVESGFARSHQTPIPLAQVICRIDDDKKIDFVRAPMCGRLYVDPPAQPYFVDFNEGVTRTFWLIANGACAFPVAVDSSEASALHSEAGLPDMSPRTIDQLFEAARNVAFDAQQRG